MFGYRTKAAAVFLVMTIVISVAGCWSFDRKKAVQAGVEEKLELAVKYLAEKKFKEAVLAYNEVITIDSKNITAYKGLGLAYTLQKKAGEAERVLKEGLKILPNDERLRLALAGLMLDEGKDDEAEAVYKQLLGRNSSSVSVYEAYSNYLIRQGRTAEAITLLEQAAARNPEQYRLESLLAELYIKNGEKEKALAAINKSLSVEPNQSSAYRQLGELYSQWSELIALGDQYIRQNQARTGFLYKLTGLYGANQFEKLISEYEKLSGDLKDSSRMKLLLAQSYRRLNNPQKADEIIKTINLAEVKDAGMLADLAYYYLETEDKDRARKAALQGIALDNSVIDNYAVMYKSYVDEDQELARVWGIRYLIASPDSYSIAFNKLIELEIDLGYQIESKESSISREIVESIVIDQARAERHFKKHPTWSQCNTYVYLDTKDNIAYKGYCKRASIFNPVVERYRSPNISKTIPENILERMKQEGETEEIKYSLFLVTETWAWPVIYQGDVPFEEHLKRAGYSVESITFVDK
ncbi:MAG: tetratricopeptide repeat protein [Syntrophothermus sp.]|uniref:tetratricopeptide repeat protein n=1 Tax=Syntrophothermus sp. TaxID=2736299 RepID=UPI00257F96D7|nr:tetratricopeptide repeat protein [Syntrophothermus sp.]NSW83346.1 tetratricopeptide repeat protein [Syntrophothermus sp.]